VGRAARGGRGHALFKIPPESFLDDYQLGPHVVRDSWWFSRVNRAHLHEGYIYFFNNLKGNFFYIKSNADI
jgi:hypothetical protein